jgi:hypothetical protein
MDSSAATTTPISHAESPAELRARAAYARRRARTLIFYEVEPNLLAFADELDAGAEAMKSPGALHR